jgi:hypothetical protein
LLSTKRTLKTGLPESKRLENFFSEEKMQSKTFSFLCSCSEEDGGGSTGGSYRNPEDKEIASHHVRKYMS